jgi:UDPglucose 6-dehydrogenase
LKITIIGSGYVGLVTAACLSEMGNDVFCLDLDENKIAMLSNGQIPIYEPGLDEIIARNCKLGRLIFSTDVKASVQHGDIQFIAVGTPPDEDGSADLKYVLAAAKNIGHFMNGPKIIVNKSTVPVGTGRKVSNTVMSELQLRQADHIDFSVVSNPEFLKEGAAIDDFMKPDRIVIGHDSTPSGIKAKEAMSKLYAPFNRNHNRILFMDVKSAELTKYAANSMLATRISFMNELANLANEAGADIEMVRQGIGSDSRIGYGFLYAGTGYGGSCFPKDVQALAKTGKEFGCDMQILNAVESVNDQQKLVLVRKICKHYGNDLRGKTFAVWGLAFKPNTDDMRAAPSRIIVRELLLAGARVIAHDPVAGKEALHTLSQDMADKSELMENFSLVNEFMDTLVASDGLVIVTEWKTYRSPNFDQMKKLLKEPIIFDGRNLYDPDVMLQMGFKYFGIGRKSN